MTSRTSPKQVIGRIVGSDEVISRYSWLNKLIMAYVGLVLLCFTLYTIAPFVTIVGKTPFYSSKSYLGILGGVLLCVDLVTNKVLWRGPYVIFLYAISVIAVISSALTRSYGISENLFLICWTVVQFSLVYSCAYRADRKTFRKFLVILFFILLTVWIIACLISLRQYALRIGYRYVSDPRSDDASLVRQGFLENRLFGIFNPLNHAAYVSLMLMQGCIYGIFILPKKRYRILLGLSAAVLFLHILLSGSRSAAISMLVCSFILGWMIAWNKSAAKGTKNAATALAFAMVVALCAAVMSSAVKAAVKKVPDLVHRNQVQMMQRNDDVPPPAIDKTLPTLGETTLQREEPDMVQRNDDVPPTAIDKTLPTLGETSLQRKGLDEDVSNGRLQIWKDYLGLADEIGLLGLSPGNYMAYIREHYPDAYIVEYVRKNFPSKFDAGLIYHTHNGYLMVLVSTGILGFALMLAFMVLCVWRCVKWIWKSENLSWEFVFLLCTVTAGAISAVFDKGIFFLDSAPTFFFWLALGTLMKMTSKRIPSGRQ